MRNDVLLFSELVKSIFLFLFKKNLSKPQEIELFSWRKRGAWGQFDLCAQNRVLYYFYNYSLQSYEKERRLTTRSEWPAGHYVV